MHKINKTLETLKFHDMNPSKIDKIEDIIEIVGTTLSSIKTKKVETQTKKESKFVYVSKVPCGHPGLYARRGQLCIRSCSHDQFA